jgi:tripartite-type tricarboxylate transporter receptor subunit TctC
MMFRAIHRRACARVVLRGLLSGLAAAFSLGALAQSAFPNKPIMIIVPYAAGGPSDHVTRVVAVRMGEKLGVQIAVENRDGANGVIVMDYAARQPGDGYTLVMFSQGGSIFNSLLKEKLPYDLLRDFRAVGNMVVYSSGAVIHPSVPAKTLPELIAYAKANPNKLSFGSSGIAGTPHLVGEMFMAQTGVQMTHIPYKGLAPANVDLLAGRIQLVFTEVGGVADYVKQGKLRVVAGMGSQRLSLMPDVPTATEQGLPNLRVNGWYGLEAPAATPTPVIAKLNEALVYALQHPDTKLALEKHGMDSDPGPAEAFDRIVREEMIRWGAVIKTANIKVN